jgi:hypothetical protein
MRDTDKLDRDGYGATRALHMRNNPHLVFIDLCGELLAIDEELGATPRNIHVLAAQRSMALVWRLLHRVAAPLGPDFQAAVRDSLCPGGEESHDD